MESEFRREFHIFLDTEKMNKLFMALFYTDDFLSVKEFVLIYLTKDGDSFREVVKYDCSQRETLHVHYFFKKHPKKEYLDLPVTIETCFELKDKLVMNWHKYLLRFNEE